MSALTGPGAAPGSVNHLCPSSSPKSGAGSAAAVLASGASRPRASTKDRCLDSAARLRAAYLRTSTRRVMAARGE